MKFDVTLPSNEINKFVKRDLAKLWPTETRDRLALILSLIIVPIVAIFELLVVTPYNQPSSLVPHIAFCAFLALNFYGNLVKLMVVDPSGGKAFLPSVLRPGFKFCSSCQMNAPPRAYHCPICNTCVFKRDHHAAFAGTCVGFFNQRYYVMATAYALIATLYCTWWHFDYAWTILDGIRLNNFWTLMIPHVAFILRFLSFVQFLTVILFMGTLSAAGACAYMMGSQVFCIYRGQTRMEYLLGIRTYDIGPYANMREVLGTRWLMAAICPFWPSTLLGDGMSFQAKLHEPVAERTKDM